MATMPLDLRNLRYFVGVVAAGSITRAAEVLHIAQPALSVQIRQVEDEMGTPLLERRSTGVVPTAAGRVFLEHARDVLARVDAIYGDVQAFGREPAGRVAIGLPQSMARILTVPLVRTVLDRWPLIHLQLIELSTGYVQHHLLTGDIDIGLTFLDPGVPGIRAHKLLDEELVVVGDSARFPVSLAGLGSKGIPLIRPEDLAGVPFVLPAGAHSLRVLLDQFQRGHSLQLRVVAEANSIAQLTDLAAAGVGCTILSYASVSRELRQGQLSAARLTESISRPVYQCQSATAQPSAALNAVQALIIELSQSLTAVGDWPTVAQASP